MTNDALDELIFLATSDISARTKGRSMRLADFHQGTSLGWVPANLGIGSLGHIVDDIPYGATGDLRLMPDHSSIWRIEGIPGQLPVSIVFCDQVKPDGTAWESCPRSFLKHAVDELKDEFGLTAMCAFEHEFQERTSRTDHHPFSLQAFKAAEPLGSQLMTVLARAGLEPENWLPEYGRHQYELTAGPTDPVHAGDRAILIREVIYDVFRSAGRETTMTPVLEPGSTGNGIHLHFSVQAADGSNAFYDASRPGRISEAAGSFAAGVLRHSPAMAAIFAPLVVSYQRLSPHNWSAARAFLGLQNREALLRIPPTNEIGGKNPANQVHFEFRGGDVGANPWLLIGCVLHAGMQGMREGLAPPEIIDCELDLDGTHRDLPSLPTSLGQAIAMLRQDDVVSGWFAPGFLKTLERIKGDEIGFLQGRSLAEQCEIYAGVY